MKKGKFIGRKKEKAILKKTLNSDEAEMVAVIGRRRVGKTFLINTVFEKHICFEITGVQNTPLHRQLKGFAFGLSAAWGKLIEKPSDWFDAFIVLIKYLETQKSPSNRRNILRSNYLLSKRNR